MMNFIKACLLWALPSVAFGQFTLSGKITHAESREAVIGATVYIPELRTGATTDAQGAYRIDNLPAGNLTVQVSFVSHKTLLQPLSIRQNTRQDFVMENAAQALEEVIVSGSSTRTVIRESPIPISAITQQRLLQQASTNLIDAVSRLPGLSQVSTGAGLSKPVIRGLGFNRVITMHDGVRQEDNQWGEEHSIQIDEYSIDRYEIIRGAGSLLYGSDGLGGVMAVLSPRPAEEGRWGGRLLLNGQSNHGLLGASLQVSGQKKGLYWLVQTSAKSAANYRNRADGRVYASAFSEPFNLNGFVGLNRRWGYARISFLRSYQLFNIITGQRTAAGRFATDAVAAPDSTTSRGVSAAELLSRVMIPYNSQRLLNHKLTWSQLLTLGNNRTLTAVASYATNRRSEFADVQRPGQAQLDLRLHTLYYDVRYTAQPSAAFELTLGANGMSQWLGNAGYQALYPDYQLLDAGVFVFGKQAVGKLKLSGGLRYDRRRLSIGRLYADADGNFQVSEQGPDSERFAGLGRLYQNLSGSLGGVYAVGGGLRLRANASRGFRAPAVPELASNGVHAGTFRYEIGNQQAVPEVAHQFDVGFNYENADWYADVSLFQNHIRHYTYSARVQNAAGADSLAAGDVPVFRYRQGNARLQGLEGTLTFNPKSYRWFSLTQGYSLVVGRNLTETRPDARYLPLMPATRWLTQLKLTRDRYRQHLRNLYVSADVEVHQRQHRFMAAYGTETATPAYTLVHVGAGGELVNARRQAWAMLYLSVNNLFDVVYQSHQSRLKYLDVNAATGRRGVFNMGRNVSLKLVVPFGGAL